MITNLFNELGTVSPILPPIARFIILIFFLMLAWAVISVPAHFLKRALDPFLTAAITKLVNAFQTLFGSARAFVVRWTVPLESFINLHSQSFSFAAENRQIRAEITRLRTSVEAIPANIVALESGVVDAGDKFSAAVDRLQSIPIPGAVQAPNNQDYYSIVAQSNTAWISLVISLVLMPAMILFNTVMLSQIIDNLWGGIEVFGYSMSIVLALGFTVIEIALGIFLVLASSQFAKIGLIALIAGVAFLEASFYARIGKGMHWSLLDAWFAQGAAPAWTQQWLGLFGLILVGGLAFCGHTFFSALRKIGESHVVSQWRRFVKGRMDISTKMAASLSAVERSRGVLTKSFDDVRTAFSAASGVPSSNLQIIETAKDGFLAEIEKASKIRLEDRRKLDRGAMIRVFVESLALFGVVLLAMALAAYIYKALTVTNSGLWLTGWWLGLTVSLGKGVMLIATGSMTNRANSTMPATDGLPATASQGAMWQFVGYGVLLIAIGSEAAFALKGFTTGGAIAFMLLAMVDVVLLLAGSRLGLMGAALISCCHSVGYATSGAAVLIAAVAAWVSYIVISIARVVLAVLAFPFRAILFRRSTPDEVSAQAAA